MITHRRPQSRFCFPFRLLALELVVILVAATSAPYAQAQNLLYMPPPGVMVSLSPAFKPAMIRGITINPANPLQFDFLMTAGDERLSQDEKTLEYERLIKYFLAALTVPEKDMWVNLSPYEKNRIISETFGKTEMGRDLLAQDYLLKQITASVIYPEDQLGKSFWDKVYKEAREKFHTADIPVNTFNKVWIVPDDAVIYEHGSSAYVLNIHLKVMLEEDYLSMENNNADRALGTDQMAPKDLEDASSVSSQVVREIVIPALEKEVNENKNFALLRQAFQSACLAAWFKKTLKESLLGQVYADQGKVKGVDLKDAKANQEIYDKYVEAFKKGVFNYIKEENDPATQEVIPRKYFSGGEVVAFSQVTRTITAASEAMPYFASLAQEQEGDITRVDLRTTDEPAPVTQRSSTEADAAMLALAGKNPNGARFEIFENAANVPLSDGKETADIIDRNNRRGEKSVIMLFTGTRGKAMSRAFVKQIIDRNIDLSNAEFFYLDEYWMGPAFKGKWHNDPRSYHYFSRENFIDLLNANGVQRISESQVHVLDGEGDIREEIDKRNRLLREALSEKAASAPGAIAEFDILNAGSGSNGHLAFIEKTINITAAFLAHIDEQGNVLVRNSNKFLIKGDVTDRRAALASIVEIRRKLRSEASYKEDLKNGLEETARRAGHAVTTVDSEKLEVLVATLQKQKNSIYIENLSDQEQRELAEAFPQVQIFKAEQLLTETVGEEELAFSTVVDNYSDFLDQIHEMTGKALTTKYAPFVSMSQRVRVSAFGPKTVEVMGEVSRMPEADPRLPISMLLKHRDGKFILDREAAKKVDTSTLQEIDLNLTPDAATMSETDDFEWIQGELATSPMRFARGRFTFPLEVEPAVVDADAGQMIIERKRRGVYEIDPMVLPGPVHVQDYTKRNKPEGGLDFYFGIYNAQGVVENRGSVPVEVRVAGRSVTLSKEDQMVFDPATETAEIEYNGHKMVIGHQGGRLRLEQPVRLGAEESFLFYASNQDSDELLEIAGRNDDAVGIVKEERNQVKFFYQSLGGTDAAMLATLRNGSQANFQAADGLFGQLGPLKYQELMLGDLALRELYRHASDPQYQMDTALTEVAWKYLPKDEFEGPLSEENRNIILSLLDVQGDKVKLLYPVVRKPNAIDGSSESGSDPAMMADIREKIYLPLLQLAQAEGIPEDLRSPALLLNEYTRNAEVSLGGDLVIPEQLNNPILHRVLNVLEQSGIKFNSPDVLKSLTAEIGRLENERRGKDSAMLAEGHSRIYNDGKAAALGEQSPKGELYHKAGMAFIFGTGNNGTAVDENGNVLTYGDALLELGHNIVRRANGTWVFTGFETKGGRPVLNEGDAEFEEHYFSGLAIARRFASYPSAQGIGLDSMKKDLDLIPEIKGVEQMLALIQERIPQNQKDRIELQKKAVDIVLKAVSSAADQKDEAAIAFIQDVGRDIGEALSSLFIHFSQDKWVENFIMVSGIGENFGRVKQGTDQFVQAIRDGVTAGLKVRRESETALTDERIGTIANGVRRSTMSWEREILASAPAAEQLAKMAEGHYIVGFSVGGTKIGAGLVDRNKNLIPGAYRSVKWDAEAAQDPRSFAEAMVDVAWSVVPTQLRHRDADWIGTAFAGPVNEESGVVGELFAPPNLPFLRWANLPQLVQEVWNERVRQEGGTDSAMVVDRSVVENSIYPELVQLAARYGYPDALALIADYSDVINRRGAKFWNERFNDSPALQGVEELLDGHQISAHNLNAVEEIVEIAADIKRGSGKVKVDHAAMSQKALRPDTFTKGGIDIGSIDKRLQIKRDGNGIALPVELQDIENIHIDGLVPHIIEILPAGNIPLLMGINDAPANQEPAASSNELPVLGLASVREH